MTRAVAAVLAAAAVAPAASGLPPSIAGFEKWRKLNAKPIPVRASDPHASVKNVYASRRRGAKGRFPVGAIVVKAGHPPGKRWLSLVAVMRKTGSRANGGWAWAEYTRSGPSERFARVGFPESGCAACHAQAKSRDYVFTAR